MPFRMALGERIRYVLNLYESRPAAAEVARVTPEHLASYIGGRAKPPFELMVRLAQDQGISMEWLASGTGNPKANEAANGFVKVPVVAEDSLSGLGVYPLVDEAREPIAFSKSWLNSAAAGAPFDQLCLVFNRGNDNSPDIRDGDAMLVHTGVSRIVHDGYYILKPGGERMITRLAKLFVDGRMALMTRETEHKSPEFYAPDDAAKILFGQVRWRGGFI